MWHGINIIKPIKKQDMTYSDDLNRIEIKHLREMLVNVKDENSKLRLRNRTLLAKNQLFIEQLEIQYRKDKL